MTLNEINEYNKYVNKETCYFCRYIYKCFDKLNLKNCIINLYKIVGAKEAMDIYRLNKIGKATISTPIGNVGSVKTNAIVRQGTIIGPKLCCMLEHLLKCTSNESIQNNVDKLTRPDNVVKIIEQNISKRESLGYKVKVCIGED